MHTISVYFLSFALTLSVYGCFGSRERGDKNDSGFDGADVAIETGGTGGRDIPKAGPGGIDGGHAAVGGSVVRPFDAAIIDVTLVQSGTDGIEDIRGTEGTGGVDIDDDAGMKDTPCASNCPDLDWVVIPGGTFMMGSAEGIGRDSEHPQHEVTVKSFKMLRTEVTVTQFGSCVDAGVCAEPGPNFYSYNWVKSDRKNHPIDNVNWDQAREFAKWIGGRLPSEAEWEYAARSGGQDIIYPWGNVETSCDHAVIGWDEKGNRCGGGFSTAEACSKPLGNTAQGLCDMVGNVYEWVEDDFHENYRGAPSDGLAWIDSPRSTKRVSRGGDTGSEARDCLSASRDWTFPDARYSDCGFRVVLDLK